MHKHGSACATTASQSSVGSPHKGVHTHCDPCPVAPFPCSLVPHVLPRAPAPLRLPAGPGTEQGHRGVGAGRGEAAALPGRDAGGLGAAVLGTRRQPRSAAGRGSTSVWGREAARGRAGQGRAGRCSRRAACRQGGRRGRGQVTWLCRRGGTEPAGLGAKRRPPGPFELQTHAAFLRVKACARLPALGAGFVPVCPGTGRGCRREGTRGQQAVWGKQ